MGLLGILLTFPVSGPILTAKAAIKTAAVLYSVGLQAGSPQ